MAKTPAVEVDEYHSRPVPMDKRLGFSQPAWVWSGFGIAFICAVIGGAIQAGLGTRDAILAIMLGNFILFLYAAALGYASGRWGMNFPLTVQAVFGRTGASVPIIILATLVTGWYSFHTWLTADIIRVAFKLESSGLVAGIALVVGLIYAIPVIFGIKSMALVRKIAIPAMVIFIAYYLFSQVLPARGRLFESQGSGDISFWAGVGIAWATFAVSGTMTGDIVRWTRTGKQAVGVTGVAFLLSNGPFMVLGALFAGAIDDPTVPYFLNSDSGPLLITLAAIAILSTWSTADACLYNASLGYSNGIDRLNWNRAGMFAAALGIALAMSGLIANVTNILITIGLIVPPVGAAIIADFFILRRGVEFAADRRSGTNVAAIVATLGGIAAGIVAYLSYPTWIFGIPGMVVTVALYVVLGTLGERLGAEKPTVRNSGEADPMPLFAIPLETV